MDSTGFALLVIFIFIIIALITIYEKQPFVFPHKIIRINITSKRNTDVLDYIDKYLLKHSMEDLDKTKKQLDKWKSDCEEKINASIFRKHRRRQYLHCCDEARLFHFCLYRTKTKYKQIKGIKHPYKVEKIVYEYNASYEFLAERFSKLKEIGFQCTLADFYENNQRKLMTKELRKKIAERDNYTCQKCGKHMPDEVGLHIDHIVPISKGGKSIPSNLQVLCSKCNGQKSDKVTEKSTSKKAIKEQKTAKTKAKQI